MSRERVYLLLLLQFIRHPIWVASSGGSERAIDAQRWPRHESAATRKEDVR